MDELARRVLDLEKRHQKHNGVKDDAIRRELNMSATAYYQILNQLLDSPDALAAEPVLVNRLRRIRNGRK